MKIKKILLLSLSAFTLGGLVACNSTPASSAVASSVVSSAAASSAAVSSAVASSAAISSASSVVSSEEQMEELRTSIIPGDCEKITTEGETKLNSVFSAMQNVTIDSGSGKDIKINDETTITSGGRFKLNGAGNISKQSIKINASTKGTFRFAATSANSKDSGRTYTLADSSGNTIFKSKEGVVTSGYEIYTIEIPAAGEYFLFSEVNGINIYYLELVQKVKLGTVTDFEISDTVAKKDFLDGEAFSAKGLDVLLVYSSGVRVPLDADKYTLDTTAFDNQHAGTYDIGVTLKEINLPKKNYKVTVHEVKGILLDTNPNNATVTDFEISDTVAKKDFLDGEAFSAKGLDVLLVYSSGVRVPLDADKYTLDTTAFDNQHAGTYDIGVTLKEINLPKKNYKVTVHEVKGILLDTNPNNAGKSGNKSVNRISRIYTLNQVVNSKAVAIAYCGEGDEYVRVVSSTQTPTETDSVGVKKVKHTFNNNGKKFTAEYDINVIDKSSFNKIDGKYKVGVNPLIDEEGKIVDGVYTFSKIQYAHDFAYACLGSSNTEPCVFEVQPGVYNEKLYIDLPHATFVGTDKEQTIIQSNYESDTTDVDGIAFSTYGSSSVTVNGSNVAFENISIKNVKYTTMKEYLDSKSGNKQAVALVTKGDNFSAKNCIFDGFQDTLYINAGYARFDNCKISGMTDFIFGEAENVYFHACEIVCKDKGDVKNNGYIVAHKPSSVDKITIGFLFNECTITGEEGMNKGTVALARSWGKDATVTFMNTSIADCISTKGYGDTSTPNNCRWEEMSGNKPTSSTYREYGNTGLGSITEAVNGGTFMNETEAAQLLAKIPE